MSENTNDFFWRMACADIAILNQSDKNSQWLFSFMGISLFVANCLVFLSFFVFFIQIEIGFLLSVFLSLFIVFLVQNIYRLNMISLEPAVLPRNERKRYLLFSYTIRFFSILAFGFICALLIETSMFLFFRWLTGIESADTFFHYIFYLQNGTSGIWTLNIVLTLLFLIPVIPKFFLRSKSEYYGIKKRIYTEHVVDQHQTIRSELVRLYELQYERYASYSNSKQEILYSDPPFNTKKIDPNEFYLDEDAFMRLTICTKEGDPE